MYINLTKRRKGSGDTVSIFSSQGNYMGTVVLEKFIREIIWIISNDNGNDTFEIDAEIWLAKRNDGPRMRLYIRKSDLT